MTSEETEKELLLAAIAAAMIRPDEAAEIFEPLMESDDDDIVEAVYEALAMAGELGTTRITMTMTIEPGTEAGFFKLRLTANFKIQERAVLPASEDIPITQASTGDLSADGVFNGIGRVKLDEFKICCGSILWSRTLMPRNIISYLKSL